MSKRKDDIKTFIVILCVCAICVIVALFFNKNNNTDKLVHVNDHNIFFSNVKYINNYISEIASKDNNTVYNLLSDKYIDDNNITVNNVFDIIGNYSVFSTFETSEMYYVNIKGDLIYYIKGKIYEETYNDRTLIDENFSIIIVVDSSNSSYFLHPVNDDNYKDVINKIRRVNITNKNYNSTKNNINVNNEQICIMYLSDFINNIHNNISYTYEILNDNMKKLYTDKNKFINYINNNYDKISTTADKCKMEEQEENRIYTVIDTNGNKYIFEENYVMNYKVDFYLKEE